MLEPKVLLLDEPTSSLDVSVQAEILNLLSDLRAARGLTYLFVSHNLAVIAHMCGRLAVMNHGGIVEEVSTAALATGALAHPYSRQLLNSSKGYDRAAVRGLRTSEAMDAPTSGAQRASDSVERGTRTAARKAGIPSRARGCAAPSWPP